MPTRIMGIDPGLTRCGVGVIDLGQSKKVTFVEVATLRTDPKAELSDRLGEVGRSIEEFILRVNPQVIAIERVFSQANLRSVMGTAQISGIALFLANRHNIPVVMHTPTEVKAAVTGSGRADKAQVGLMVAKILGLAEVPKPADAADSLAIAICQAWKGVGATAMVDQTQTAAQKAWHTAIKQASKST